MVGEIEFLPMHELKKFQITVDGTCVAEFYHTNAMGFHERDILRREFADYNFISSRGVRVYSVQNDNKLNGVFVIPFYGKVR